MYSFKNYFDIKLVAGTVILIRKRLNFPIYFNLGFSHLNLREAILRTVSKSGTGNTKEMAINIIIRSIKYDDLTIIIDR
jgi:hypothetical protein